MFEEKLILAHFNYPLSLASISISMHTLGHKNTHQKRDYLWNY